MELIISTSLFGLITIFRGVLLYFCVWLCTSYIFHILYVCRYIWIKVWLKSKNSKKKGIQNIFMYLSYICDGRIWISLLFHHHQRKHICGFMNHINRDGPFRNFLYNVHYNQFANYDSLRSRCHFKPLPIIYQQDFMRRST